MPAMPRTKEARKIAAKIMRQNRADEEKEKPEGKTRGETKFERNIRTMIKR